MTDWPRSPPSISRARWGFYKKTRSKSLLCLWKNPSVELSGRISTPRTEIRLRKVRVCLTLLCQIICTRSTPTFLPANKKWDLYVSMKGFACSCRCVQHGRTDVNQMMPYSCLFTQSVQYLGWSKIRAATLQRGLRVCLPFGEHLLKQTHCGEFTKGTHNINIVTTQQCYDLKDCQCRLEASLTPAEHSSYFWDCCGFRSHYCVTQGRDFCFLRSEVSAEWTCPWRGRGRTYLMLMLALWQPCVYPVIVADQHNVCRQQAVSASWSGWWKSINGTVWSN